MLVNLDKLTDTQILERMDHNFKVLNDMTVAASNGVIRGMIVSGGAGVGKSFGIGSALKLQNEKSRENQKSNFLRIRAAILSVFGSQEIPPVEEKRNFSYQILKGYSRPLFIYKKLFELRNVGEVTVFDDCDSVFKDETGLNILKAALDSAATRTIVWGSSKLEDGLPDKFEYNGSVIFVTNQRFDSSTNSVLQNHLNAIISRCHFMDLSLHSNREKLLRIRQVVKKYGMLKREGLNDAEEDQILNFIEENSDNLLELSLRMALKIVSLYKISRSNWRTMAQSTCLKQRSLVFET